ncbi:MAG: hypothetical protein OXE95_01875 [Chloroflexi bacterium]|nr:hypothetical protein [Chloroflexota bacterium]MCY4246309.1 hypothetical protein [Chloroflexota bacterium]
MTATQSELAEALRHADTATDKRDAALRLLARTNSRALLDECLRALGSSPVLAALDEGHRPILRRKCLRYFEEPRRDKAGLLREALTRLLVHIAHPADGDIFQLGVDTYHLQPVADVAQNLRAAALAGLAPIDPPLARLYATRFLGEEHTSVFNCEPAMTALDVLAASEQRLPIYQFLLRAGESMAQTGRGELVGKALESLGADFPAPLYAQLLTQYREIDQATASMGIINCVVAGRQAALYDQLEMLILQTRHVDLRRYGLVMMAAARDEALSERLLRMARVARREDVPLFIDALEICQHAGRDDLAASLRRRL